jgi:hypothetical protein
MLIVTAAFEPRVTISNEVAIKRKRRSKIDLPLIQDR